MFKNYLITALRNLVKNKLYSLINIAGFAVSIVCVILIMLFINHELGYDRYWAKSDRTYKVMTTFLPIDTYGGLEIAASASIISLLLQDFPRVEQAVRLVGNTVILTHPDDNSVDNEQGIYFADANVHEVFDIPPASGSWEQALDGAARMVINETLARKYFGDREAVGQRLIVGNQAPMLITAVMRDLEDNTHLEILPVTDVHLYSQREFELQPNGSITVVYTFSALALFVLRPWNTA